VEESASFPLAVLLAFPCVSIWSRHVPPWFPMTAARFSFQTTAGSQWAGRDFGRFWNNTLQRPALNQISHRIHCVILLLRIFLKMVLICVPFRKCSVIPIFLRHRFTLRWTPEESGIYTAIRTQEP
jgi:recomb_XerD: tyrosine recombinase XerD